MSTAAHLRTAEDRLTANQCLGNALAVVGTVTTGFNTTGTPVVSSGGILQNLTAQISTALSALLGSDLPTISVNGVSTTNPWVQPSGLAAFYVQPANTTAYYVVGVNAAGTWRAVQGTYDGQSLTNIAGYSGAGKSVIPDVPDGLVPVFVIKVASGGSTFTVGTTALTGISTFKNVNVLPTVATF